MLVAGLAAGVGGWLTFGAGDAGEPARVDTAGVLVPAPPADANRSSRPGRDRPDPAAEAAIALAAEDRVEVEFEDPPAAGLLFDLDTGRALWARNPKDEAPIASLTKIMTALLVDERIERATARVEIGPQGAGPTAAGGVTGSAVGLEPGMRVKSGALFHAMLVASANDAATALAIEVAGSADRFVTRMNRRARRLDLDCTRFVSAHGLEPGNRSCAADLGALARLAMDEPRIRRVASKPRAVVDFPIEGGERHLATTNPLLEAGYEGTIGLKTGYTVDAGASVVAVVRRGGDRLAVVLLDSPDVAGQAERLFGAGFAANGKRLTRAPGRTGRADPAGRGSAG